MPGLRPAAAFFFAQQVAEKALKAVMTARQLVPSRTHNVWALAAELNAAGIATSHTPDELVVLNPYTVTLRHDARRILRGRTIDECRSVEVALVLTRCAPASQFFAACVATPP